MLSVRLNAYTAIRRVEPAAAEPGPRGPQRSMEKQTRVLATAGSTSAL